MVAVGTAVFRLVAEGVTVFDPGVADQVGRASWVGLAVIIAVGVIVSPGDRDGVPQGVSEMVAVGLEVETREGTGE